MIKTKYILYVVLTSILFNILIVNYNINKFNNYQTQTNGDQLHRIIKSDVYRFHLRAEQFKNNLENKNIQQVFPIYKDFYLYPILLGTYYKIIDKPIFTKEFLSYNSLSDKILFKPQTSYMFGIMLIQILIYNFSVLIFIKKLLKMKYELKYVLFLLIFFLFEPTINQWHASLWSESVFLSLFLLSLTICVQPNRKIMIYVLGILVGLMFLQRAIALGLILIFLIYIFLISKNRLQHCFILIFGYLSIIVPIIFNNYSKTNHFFVLPYLHQFYSNYHYFNDAILADKLNISETEARNIKLKDELLWVEKNNIEKFTHVDNINKDNIKNFYRYINYKHNYFLNTVKDNPIYTFKFFAYKSAQSLILDPIAVKKSFSMDKTITDRDKKKEMYNPYIEYRIFYSFIIYLFSLIGLILFLNKLK